MMRGILTARLAIACAGALLAAAPGAAAAGQSSYGYGYLQQPENAAGALARHVRTLASRPKDFGALIGAGKASLEIGDAQAAAGFFARADEVSPRSPLPQAGMGAVSVANGEPQAAMPYFTRALQLGAAVTQIACDRGLAYDLLGQQAKAQADYRAALNGPDATEARRRLSLSLAISGDKAGALQALAGLAGRSDYATGRVRAFVLALTGDSQGAMTAIDAAMPGSWSRVAPFLQRLPALGPGQKAAAVNLGIFPDAGTPALAANSLSSPYSRSATTDRLAGIDELLRARSPAPAAPPPPQPTWQPAPTQVAYTAPPVRRQAAPLPAATSRKVWLQLASGANADALPDQFRRLKSRGRDLFDGISGYVARSPDRARLVIGPFRGQSDAQIFQEDLQTMGIDAFSWTNSESDRIVPLGTE
jgi:tetratricopeptide (TPR) repeat protein